MVRFNMLRIVRESSAAVVASERIGARPPAGQGAALAQGGIEVDIGSSFVSDSHIQQEKLP